MSGSRRDLIDAIGRLWRAPTSASYARALMLAEDLVDERDGLLADLEMACTTARYPACDCAGCRTALERSTEGRP